MKTKLAILALCGLAATLQAQTPPLTPSGPPTDPATAMKSLNQVEPRTIIDQVPFTISQSGSYYFTKNLHFTATTGNAINVNASNVTIDLHGFTLSSAAAVTGTAISCNGKNLTIKNGTIAGTTTVDLYNNWATVPGGFDSGIGGGDLGCHFSGLTIYGCRFVGLTASDSTLVDVCVHSNGSAGIQSYRCSIRNCIARLNSSIGIQAVDGTVEGCIVSKNQSDGVAASVVINTQAVDNGDDGIFVYDHGVATSCRSYGNSGANIAVQGANATRTGNNPAP